VFVKRVQNSDLRLPKYCCGYAVQYALIKYIVTVKHNIIEVERNTLSDERIAYFLQVECNKHSLILFIFLERAVYMNSTLL